MEREAFVCIDRLVSAQFVGRLRGRSRKGRGSASFEYDRAWLEDPAKFSLEPALTLGPGPFHEQANKPVFGAIGLRNSTNENLSESRAFFRLSRRSR